MTINARDQFLQLVFQQTNINFEKLQETPAGEMGCRDSQLITTVLLRTLLVKTMLAWTFLQ